MTRSAASADVRGEILQELLRRFQPSQIEIQDPARQGAVTRRGRVLVLAGDGVPAKPFRVVQVGRTHKVRRHVMDFARIDITPDGGSRAEPAPFALSKGTHMVILDLKLAGDELHFLAHTADPLGAQPDGDLVYGCTEFVFHLEPATLAAGSVGPVVAAVERWLQETLIHRTCQEGVREICIEP